MFINYKRQWHVYKTIPETVSRFGV